MNPDIKLSVALEVGHSGTGCCCIVHCVHHQRAFLRLIVNSNKVSTHGHTLRWPLPYHSYTCIVCSGFSSHSNWSRNIWKMTTSRLNNIMLSEWCYTCTIRNSMVYLVVGQTLFLLCSPSCVLQHLTPQWWCSMCCSGGWTRWHLLLLLYCPLCTSSENLLQVGSELWQGQHTWAHPDVTTPMTLWYSCCLQWL